MSDPQVLALRREPDPHLRYRMAVERLRCLRDLVSEVELVRAEATAQMADEPMILAAIAKEVGLSVTGVFKLVRKGEASLGWSQP